MDEARSGRRLRHAADPWPHETSLPKGALRNLMKTTVLVLPEDGFSFRKGEDERHVGVTRVSDVDE